MNRQVNEFNSSQIDQPDAPERHRYISFCKKERNNNKNNNDDTDSSVTIPLLVDNSKKATATNVTSITATVINKT